MRRWSELKQRVLQAVDGRQKALCRLARAMFEQPEVGLQERAACRWLCEFLAEEGFQVERGIAGLETAFRATYRGSDERPALAYLAEYDALPGIGHGCGHNLIGAASVGAAAALKAAWPDLPGSVLVLGTPAEEGAVDGAGGKVALLEAGAFEGVDAALMFHPSSRTTVYNTSLGRVALKIAFRGKAAHASGAPHEGINALEAAILTFNGINALRQHLVPDARVHGIISHGGTSPNIVPEYAEIRLYVRAADRACLQELEEKVKNCARAGALATGAKVEFSYTAHTYQNLRTNKALARAFANHLRELGVPVDESEQRPGGSTDMGNVSQRIPAIHPYVAVVPSGVVGHSREFAEATVSESGLQGMLLACKALALTGLQFLGDSQLREEVLREHQAAS